MIEIRKLVERDICSGFTAGVGSEKLDAFLQLYAKQNNRRCTSATYVAVDENKAIVGYTTIVPGAVSAPTLQGVVKGLPPVHPVPVLILARMAVDAGSRQQGIGTLLMQRLVFPRTLDLATNYGCVGTYVDAKAGAVRFYVKHGFVTLVEATADSTTQMFLPLTAARAALAAANP
ncbi:MAG TPA: GNAT family N-acetyltransferase [Myxococcales bacterium]